MASHELKHRTKETEGDQPDTDTATVTTTTDGSKSKRDKRAMAKRGLRSLAVALMLPLSLTFLNLYFFGSSHQYNTARKPFWVPPLWLLHTTCLVSSFLMGLSAWLVWADGGFHSKPIATPLYLGWLALSLAWDPIVFKLGATRVGLVVATAMFGSLVGCYKVFREVNPTAGDLVKLCLAGACLITVVNFKLVSM